MSVKARETQTIQSDSVAKGAICLMAGQFSLLIAGYVVHAYVGRELGLVRYGVFGVVMALLVWFEVSLTGAFPYAIRKFGSENRSAMPKVARTALKGQFIYASIIFLLVELLAPWMALALGDRHLGSLIRVASLDIPAYAAYFCYLGVLNGSGAFVKQAIAGEDERLLRVYVNQSFRLHLMLLMPLTAIVSAGASGIVRLVYRSGYDAASGTLAVLIAAYMFWGLLNGVFNLMVADRQTKYPVAAVLILAVLMVVSFGAYIIVLIMSREITRQDFVKLASVTHN